jgi:hypothetical protein
MSLSARDRAILDFERTWRHQPGPKEVAIREHFHMSASRYYSLLSALLEDDDALSYDPLTVKRAQRVRNQRRRVRMEGGNADPTISSPSQAPALRQRSARPPLPRSR